MPIGAGIAHEGNANLSEIVGDSIRFGFVLPNRDGEKTYLEGSVPKLTVPEALEMIRARMRHFRENVEGRESVGDKVRRKAIAAQGRIFVAEVAASGSKAERMELGMMMSPHSHTQLVPLSKVRGLGAPRVSISRHGSISGLPAGVLGVLPDNEGRLFRRALDLSVRFRRKLAALRGR